MRLLCLLVCLACIPSIAAEDLSTNWFRWNFGGETRQRFEYFGNPGWGLEPEDHNGHHLQRYMLHAGLKLGKKFRLFGELKSGIETGRNGGPRPADADQLDVHQAFAELDFTSSQSLRVGRQEISLGSSRLIGIREGPNVRLSFDGSRLSLKHRNWKVDAFALRPAETNRGRFDDSPNHKQSLWGLYASGPAKQIPGNLDLYYLGIDRKVRVFDQGRGRELRHTFGIRYFRKPLPWDYDFEAMWQSGEFASARIQAWSIASNSGYTLKHLPFQPRLGLKADIASGDKNPSDKRLGTFNALYPKGAYFSEADLLGPYNIIDLHPSIQFRLTHNITLTPDADFFWRQSTRDGVYDMPGNLLISGRSSTARYVGNHANLAAEWHASHHLTFEAHYLHFFPGAFLEQTRLNRPVNFVGLWMKFKF